jgi:cephalosporin-C deacetylase-like acetyl esterase
MRIQAILCFAAVALVGALVVARAQTISTAAFEAELTKEAMGLLAERRAKVAQLKTKDQILARSALVRAKLLEQIGGLPTVKTPLRPQVTRGFQRQGYRVENVIFESIPGFRVTGNLYLPDGAGPHPAVIGVAGHSVNGKAAAIYQHAWIGFVKRGYAVFAIDPPGQGERIEYFDPELGRSKLAGPTREHMMAGTQCLLTGQNLARYQIWDGIRAFDYLTTRKEIDASRVAVAGNSGGGTQAAYLAVFEPRLAAVVSSCYMTGWDELWGGPGPQDSEQVFARFLADGFDFGDFPLAFAPKPFLMATGTRDYFPIAAARRTHSEAVNLFERLGVSRNAGFFEFDDKHGWSKPRREASARWLDRHLKNIQTDGAEPEIEPEVEGMLHATPDGHLALAYGDNETVFSLNRKRAAELEAGRRLKAPPSAGLVAGRLGIRMPVAKVEPDRVWLGKGPAVLLVGTSETDPDIAEYRQAGYTVALVQPRGYSAVNAAPARGEYRASYQLAARTWLLGKPLAGMQVGDVLAAHAWLRGTPGVDPSNIALVGKGGFGLIALMAAALDPTISRVATERSVLSYGAIVNSKLHDRLEHLIVPGVLIDFDIPELAHLLEKRTVAVISPVNPSGSPLSIARAAREVPAAWRVSERGEKASALSAHSQLWR